MVGSLWKAYHILSNHRSYAESICCFPVILIDKAARKAVKK